MSKNYIAVAYSSNEQCWVASNPHLSKKNALTDYQLTDLGYDDSTVFFIEIDLDVPKQATDKLPVVKVEQPKKKEKK